MSKTEITTLFKHAQIAMQNAYSPYSKFTVGAAIRSHKGNYYKGANIENASYSLTLCAEATAIAHMVQAGDRQIAEILVTSRGDALCPPCGACRQLIAEFAKADTLVHLCDAQGIYKTFTIDDLLPESFSPELLPDLSPDIL